MPETVIKVENLGKKYHIGHRASEPYSSLRDVITEKTKSIARKISSPFKRNEAQATSEEFWALKDVSFDVKKGEVIGIIGRNGAGKTTLLKLLSRITEPTSGRFKIKGRVASLLEVGTGFHPELTGRENIFLNGAILGMSKAEIKTKFDEIVDFAEIERFLDTPVKRYSSGMYVRLAFAVAAHLEPEILIIDEVLAVGDARFQKKCLGKMKVESTKGRTILFVSHNMTAIQNLCKQAILLDNGQIISKGNTHTIVSSYLEASEPRLKRDETELNKDTGNALLKMHSASVYPSDKSASYINIRTPVSIEFDFSTFADNLMLGINIEVYNDQNILAFVGGEYVSKDVNNNCLPLSSGRYKCKCIIPADILNDGTYTVNLFFGKDGRDVVYEFDNILTFEVFDSSERRGSTSHHRLPGVFRPFLKWETIKADNSVA